MYILNNTTHIKHDLNILGTASLTKKKSKKKLVWWAEDKIYFSFK